MSASFYLFIYVRPTSFGVCVCASACVSSLSAEPFSPKGHINFYGRNRKGGGSANFVRFFISKIYLSQNLWAKVIISVYLFFFSLQMHFRSVWWRISKRCFSFSDTLRSSERSTRLWPNFLEMRNDKFYYLLRVTNIIKINCFAIRGELSRTIAEKWLMNLLEQLIKSLEDTNGMRKKPSSELNLS